MNDCVRSVDNEDQSGSAIRAAYLDLTGTRLPDGDWPLVLHAALSRNELVFQLSESLARPRPLHELPPELEKKVGRLAHVCGVWR